MAWTSVSVSELEMRVVDNLPKARTEAGLIVGSRDGSVQCFKGVPFAAPPVGPRRWRRAEPPIPWSGERLATSFGPQAPQPAVALLPPSEGGEDEDCLYLNLWTGGEPSERRPVMVWIHGGAFVFGTPSIPLYDGSVLAAKGVVVVALSYRLGVLGFLSHPELSEEGDGASGNYAMSDIVQGLRWIRDNIAEFGGDPDNVTIFGESAGSHLVSYLLCSPPAQGLFHKAIAQSGAHLTIDGPNLATRAATELLGQRYSEELGAASIAELRAMPASALVAAAGGSDAPERMFLSNIDGYYLPEHPGRVMKEGRATAVPLLTGWNAEEGLLFRDHWARIASPAAFEAMATKFAGSEADALLAAYPTQGDPQALRSAITFAGDMMFGYQNWLLAEYQSAVGQPTFVYSFRRQTPDSVVATIAPNLKGSSVGALHGAEIGYVFGHPGRGFFTSEADDSAEQLATVMSSYWVNFATTGDPNGAGLAKWPAHHPGSERFMLFDTQASADELPDLARFRVLHAAIGKKSKAAQTLA